MTENVTNTDLYGVLMGIKEDIGGLKATAGLQLKALENHGERIVALEGSSERQKGAVKVWGLVATAAAAGAATLIGAVVPGAIKLFKH